MNTNGILIHSFRIPAKNVKKKIIYHFSDVHLTEHDSQSNEDEVRRALEGTAEWEELRVSFAKDNGEVCDASQLASTREHFENLISSANDGDALVMAGDVCDFISGANLRTLDSELGKLRVPFVSVCGNHERAEDIPEGHLYSAMKEPVQVTDLGDMMIFGIDNSRRKITSEQNEQLKKVLSEEKPMLIAMHVPVRTEGNAAQFEKCGEYFQLNHSGASPEVYEFIDIIKENADKIIAVLAGHLHFASNSEIAPGVVQYVSTQGALGNVNRYEIGE
jgi:DNA repair exonuclease SbcCD nuclease subunit